MINFGIAFRGDGADFARLAAVCGTTVGRLEVDGMGAHVPDFVRDQRTDPFSHPEMDDLAELPVCPVACALSLHLGYDPSAILLLETIGCDVTVHHPNWPVPIRISAGDTRDDVCAPLAPGMLWMPDPLEDDPILVVLPEEAGIPDTLRLALPDRLVGRPLREFVSHPVLDRIGIQIAGGRFEAADRWTFRFEEAPEPVGLREAIASAAMKTKGQGSLRSAS